MSGAELGELQTAILTICDPRGNWKYGWAMICRLAGVDPETHAAPFRTRTEDELRQLAELGNAPSTPPMCRVRPPREEGDSREESRARKG